MTISAERAVAVVRPMDADDIEAAVRIHRASLPASFFCDLGADFLAGYYESFMLSPHGVAVVATVDGQVVGVLAGTVDDGAHYQWVVQNRTARMARTAVRQMIRRPRLAVHFLHTRARRYARGLVKLSRRKQDVIVLEPNGTLTHVAVATAQRGRGIGSQLIDAFLAEVRRAGVATHAALSTRSDNPATCRLYERLGWKVSGRTCDMDGNEYHRFRFDLS